MRGKCEKFEMMKLGEWWPLMRIVIDGGECLNDQYEDCDPWHKKMTNRMFSFIFSH